MRGLDSKVVFVTGGASGIGAATATRFAEEGATVVVTDVDEERGTETVRNIEDDGGDAAFSSLDVTDYEAFQEALEATVETYGSIDVLFNNAGIGEAQSFKETTLEHRDKLIEVNLKGVWNGCHAVLPLMKQANGGAIVNTASMAGWIPTPITTYAMTKAAVLHFTRSVAHEMARHDVRINAICPGTIKTTMLNTWYTEAEREGMIRRNAIKRLGKPEEIASCVAFLASNDASFITGKEFKVDGGYV